MGAAKREGQSAAVCRRTVAEAPARVGDSELCVTISVGVRWQPEPVPDWDTMFEVPDRALHAAKSLSRDRVLFDDVALPPSSPTPQRHTVCIGTGARPIPA